MAGCGQREAVQRGDGPTQAEAPVASLSEEKQQASDPDGLHNLMRVSDRIYSGSEPHGEEGFESLHKLGVKTVVSVDGAKPNVELANKCGFHYVHIPIGYDGIPQTAGEMLARLVKDGEGPFYIHCHHGKHRGPAAAAVACIASGETEGKDALHILERAGTSKGYAGLWRDVENYMPPVAGAELPELVEVAEVNSFAAAMAQIDRSFDNLKLCRDAGWATPPDHPDIVPAQEALLLHEGLHEAGRNLEGPVDEQLKTWLAEADENAVSLLASLRDERAEGAGEQFNILEQTCKQCHKKYRDQ